MIHSTLQYRSICCSGYDGPDCQRKNYHITANVFLYDMMCCYVYVAICSQSCANGGRCSAPNTCSCSAGWTGYDCTNGEQTINYVIVVTMYDIRYQ